MMERQMDKKVILITGSSRGIGADLAEKFVQKNYNVVINYSKSTNEANELCNKITQKSGDNCVLCVQADVGDRLSVNRMFDAIMQKFGKIDVLVNNAGINKDGPFLTMTGSQWAEVITTILTGAFNCSQEYSLRYRGDCGHIINIGAVTGISGRKDGINYCTARAGILNFTHCLALELAPKICVNTVTPGYINTEEVMHRRALHIKENLDNAIARIPSARLGIPDDIFKAIYFLVNDSSFITGQNLIVDGGYLMR
jgi:3-oxoacyl-[acyl-carrier protein] reductase